MHTPEPSSTILNVRGLAAIAVMGGLSCPTLGQECPDEKACTLVHACHPGPHGHLEGGPLLLPRSEPDPLFRAGQWNVDTILLNGPSNNRLDLVFVCDGYTSAEIGAFAPRAQSALDELFDLEPFKSYENYFNAHRVDVISAESGVDNDPNQGVSRNTALDMAFWCSGIERLLCVNVSKAEIAAQLAPDVDQIFAVANSTKYGGAGYTNDDLGTFSSDNASSYQVAIHELGHSLGNLADEYTYGGPTNWPGGEPDRDNVSIYPFEQMQSLMRKWHLWLGHNQPGLGNHGTYEGANYSELGIYRPTDTSMMRELGVPFNMPSQEALIIEIQKVVNFLEAYSPASDDAPWGTTLSVDCLEPTHGLTYAWFRNNMEIEDADGPSLDLTTVPFMKPGDSIRVDITDNTTRLRNEVARNNWMRESHTWNITAPTGPEADFNGDNRVNGADLGILLLHFGTDNASTDLNNDGIVDGGDLGGLLSQWTG